jgi:hypothetical protein
LTSSFFHTIISVLFRNKGSILSQTCPISLNRIDAHLVRIIAAQVITVALLLLFTHHLLFAFVLLFDFSVRIFKLKKLSLFAMIANFIISHFQIASQPCDEAPKRFALYLGLAIIILFTLLFGLKLTLIASLLVGILLICAFLEAAFDYCIGCKIYYLIQLLTPKK